LWFSSMTMSVWTGAPGGGTRPCGEGDGRAEAVDGRAASW